MNTSTERTGCICCKLYSILAYSPKLAGLLFCWCNPQINMIEWLAAFDRAYALLVFQSRSCFSYSHDAGRDVSVLNTKINWQGHLEKSCELHSQWKKKGGTHSNAPCTCIGSPFCKCISQIFQGSWQHCFSVQHHCTNTPEAGLIAHSKPCYLICLLTTEPKEWVIFGEENNSAAGKE